MNTIAFGWYTRAMEWLWHEDVQTMRGWQRRLKLSLRMVYVLARDLFEGELSLRATGLVYTTLLSVVPLLAVSFSMLKGFGAHSELEPLLNHFLAPLGSGGQQLSATIIGFVENVKVGVLGSLGLLFLLYTVVSLTQKVESAFNSVWQVERMRALAQRIAIYLSVILVGPVLVFSALGLTASILSDSLVQGLMDVEALGWLVASGSRLLPYLLVVVAFVLAYRFVPNTQVRLVPALVGGIVAGLLWQSSGWVFATFIASSSRYAAIYSGFAILILLLIWLYMSWLILLLGTRISFYVQYPQYLTRRPVGQEMSNRLREYLALQLMFMIAERHLQGREPCTLEELVRAIGLPAQPVYHVLRILEDAGFVSATSSEPPEFLPRRDVEHILLKDLFRVIHRAGEDRLLSLNRLECQTEVEAIMQAMQLAVETELGRRTLKDVIASGCISTAGRSVSG